MTHISEKLYRISTQLLLTDELTYAKLSLEMKKVLTQWRNREGLNTKRLRGMADLITDEPNYTYHQRIDIEDKEKAILILGELDVLLQSLENRIDLPETHPANTTRRSFARAKGMLNTILKFQVRKM